MYLNGISSVGLYSIGKHYLLILGEHHTRESPMKSNKNYIPLEDFIDSFGLFDDRSMMLEYYDLPYEQRSLSYNMHKIYRMHKKKYANSRSPIAVNRRDKRISDFVYHSYQDFLNYKENKNSNYKEDFIFYRKQLLGHVKAMLDYYQSDSENKNSVFLYAYSEIKNLYEEYSKELNKSDEPSDKMLRLMQILYACVVDLNVIDHIYKEPHNYVLLIGEQHAETLRKILKDKTKLHSKELVYVAGSSTETRIDNFWTYTAPAPAVKRIRRI